MPSMFESASNPPAASPQPRYLHPGQVGVSSQPTTYSAIVGSCIAVCMYDAARRIGGMVHYMLPEAGADCERSPRYGDIAIPRLLESMLQQGAQRESICARVYGGACVLRAFRSRDGLVHPGERNREVALRLLREAHIGVVDSDTGGETGRKIFFETATGHADVHVLGTEHGN